MRRDRPPVNPPVTCPPVQEALGAAMDGDGPAPPEALEHAAACPACSAFHRGAWRLRELARFEVAPAVPDLAPAIMARVREEARQTNVRPLRVPGRRVVDVAGPRWPRVAADAGGRPRMRTGGAGRRAMAAALVAGLVVGFVLGSGALFPRRTPDRVALADEIPDRLVEAAESILHYRATFEVVELNWSEHAPRRTFTAHVAFLAPESLRVEVRDTTRYPSGAWPRNDLLLVTDGRTHRTAGPDPCPRAALPECPEAGPTVRAARNRPPFDPRAAMPTDLIVPMTVLAASDRVEVVGEERVAGRDAVSVQLAYQDAASLLEPLRFRGSWRPFYPRDRVVVALDRATWFPLAYRVFPEPGPARAEWAAREGLPAESPGGPVYSATTVSRSTTDRPPVRLFAGGPDGPARDLGYVEGSPSEAAIVPRNSVGMTPWRFGVLPRTAERPYETSVLAFARGLSWLTVTHVRGWDQEAVFGVGPYAEPVDLPGVGPTLYEPATSAEPRRLALHTEDGEVLVATNLPRRALLEVASSLPVRAEPAPAAWRVRAWAGGTIRVGAGVEEAIRTSAIALLVPGYLPPGYRPSGAAIFEGEAGRGATLVYRRAGAELDGVGLRLHQAAGQEMPPPTGGDEQAVPVRGVSGRWSPQAHTLEWVEDGIYRSLGGPSFDLPAILRVAASLRPAGGPQ